MRRTTPTRAGTTVRNELLDTMHAGFRHEAFLYAGEDEFLEGTLPFVHAAIGEGDPVLAVLDPEKIGALRRSTPRDSPLVEFADMRIVGANPARIIPAWQDFIDRFAGKGRRLRGIGEPAWSQRGAIELDECYRHEAVLNVAFPEQDFWLLCPYDVGQLPDGVVEGALRNHPFVRTGAAPSKSEAYAAETVVERTFGGQLEDPPPGSALLRFGAEAMPALRQLVRMSARQAGLRDSRNCDLVVAVNEIATNSIVRGCGGGTLAIWCTADTIICEVRGRGMISDPMVGRRRPTAHGENGRGLWLVNQLCDLVQIRSAEDGNVVRTHMRLP
jgi:anti-sigma regulatory factor (Ser/Thr protein kinase)